jgi:hypothetical protein
MQDGINKPIFIVGSPRSGTSILTWCLGQHPNIIPVEESDWLGDFAIHLGIYYQTGIARGDYSLLSSMDVKKAEFFSVFGKSINELILRHRADLNRKRWQRAAGPNAVMGPRMKSQLALNPKARWVDATPEYSLHICGLRKLFPDALFIHIFRDVTSVVRSMLNFHHIAGTQLVANEENAYKYWLRTVRACLRAEQAYGPDVVHRIRYVDLIDNPEPTVRSLLEFLEEPYSAKCLEPLERRINSSEVPADFKSADAATDPGIVREAVRLCGEIEETPQPAGASSAAAAKMETAFRERVKYVETIDTEEMERPVVSLTKSNQPTDVDWRTQ